MVGIAHQVEKKLEKNTKKKMTEKQIKLFENVLSKLNNGEDLKDFEDYESNRKKKIR